MRSSRAILLALCLSPSTALALSRVNCTSNNINFGGSTNSISVSVTTTTTNALLLALCAVNINTVTNLSAPTTSGASLTWSSTASPARKLTPDTGGMVWVSSATSASTLSAQSITCGWTGDSGSAASITVCEYSGASSSMGTPVGNAQGPTTTGNPLTISNTVTTSAGSMIAMIGMDYDDAWDSDTSTVDGASTVLHGGASGSNLLSIPDLSWVQGTTSTVASGSHTLSRASSATINPSSSGACISVGIEILASGGAAIIHHRPLLGVGQ